MIPCEHGRLEPQDCVHCQQLSFDDEDPGVLSDGYPAGFPSDRLVEAYYTAAEVKPDI